MARRIHILPDLLVKKIAAGEVIERPASVVKELMENAVDAGATRIGVAVEDGGRALIRVTDDGCGMSPDDLPLAVTPHATSKLREEDDLYRIASLGFRGEALGSIGAVSRLRIVSRPHDADEGAEIIVEAEEVRTSRAAGCPPGTCIEVRDLFFNVPARRKFLRQASTESGHISAQFARIALAYPHVAFDLSSNGRTSHSLPANASRRERIGQLYSRELADGLIEFRRDESPVGVEGYAAPPADTRSNTNWQFAFINGRFIRDKYVQHAVKEAYRGLIDPHRAPVVFLFLTIDPSWVDVNVHPTKIEVRWRESSMVHSQVLSALREALQSADLTPRFDVGRGFSRSTAAASDPQAQDWLRRDFAESLKQGAPFASAPQPDADEPWTTAPPDGGQGSPYAVGTGGRGQGGHSPPYGRNEPGVTRPAGTNQGIEAWHALYGSGSERGAADSSAPTLPASTMTRSVRGAIQLHNTYLVCETDDGMVIIDQHALHERILYDRLKQRITSSKLESQRLLLPETVPVTAMQQALLETHAALLDQIGLEVSPFGNDSVAIHAIPAILRDADAVGFLRNLLDKLERADHEPSTEHVLEDLLQIMSCKAAVKAGDPLTPDEIEALIRQRDSADKPSNCPHGRPTTLRLTVQDLERQFKRT